MLGYELAGTISAALCFIAGTFVYRSNPTGWVNRSYAILMLFVTLWGVAMFFHVHSTDVTNSLFWGRFMHSAAVFLPSVYFVFVVNLLELWERKRRLALFFLGVSLVFLALSLTPAFIASVSPKLVFNYFVDPGILYPLFIVFWIVTSGYSLKLLYDGFKEKSGHQRMQIAYVAIASLWGFCGGATTFLVVYGVDITLLNSYGIFLVSFFNILIGYAIIRHQLMDIEVIIRRTAVFAGLFAFVYGTFTVISIIGQEFFKKSLGWNQWMSMIPTVMIITFSLRPLENLLTNMTERFLFQKKYDYRQLLKTFADEILTILDLQKLMDQTVLQLTKIVKLESACVLLHQKEEKSYTIVAASGFKEKDAVFHDDDILIRYLREGHHPIQRDKESEKVEGDGQLKEEFKKIKAQLCLPIMLHDELIGVLAIGMKKSGEDYTQEDIDILATLARTEAIAISNAQLFDELSKTQAEAAQREKMAVIGTLAAGINHEICNPLGIVRGQCEMFLLNMRDGLYKEKTLEQMTQISSDIMAKVIKETDRATGITKKLSSFAKPSKKNEIEEVSVAGEVDEILALLGHDLKISNIEFRLNLPSAFPDIYVDRKQFQEILFNIIRNAAQAMDKKAGYIAIDGFVENSFAAVRISDNGMGIPKEKINQIFNPFYTTKAPGKGTGLGLFIVKQVVERNKGTIEVDSVDGEGTTFVLRFPCAAKLAAA